MAADAAGMVLAIQNGTEISTMPVRTAENYAVFDYKVMKQFSISRSQLEKVTEGEATYLNTPINLFEEHKRVLMPAIIIVLLLILIICGSALMLRRQKKLSTELRKKDLMLENLLNNIPGGVAIYQIKDNALNEITTVYSSGGVPKLSGRTTEEYQEWIRGGLFSNTVYPEDLPKLLMTIAECIPAGRPINFQYRLKHIDGSYVWIMLSAVQISNVKNERIYYAVYTDISQQIKLQQAERMEMEAKLANQAKSQFLSTVSHDMRTPLNGILGLTDLMLSYTKDHQTKEDLLQVKNSGHYLLALINDTLDISKIESGSLEFHPTVCDGRRIYDNIITLLKPIVDQKNIELKINTQNLTFAKLYIDIGRIEQIVMNVMSNAVKFSMQGAVIECYVENVSIQNGVVTDRITVIDHGIGMSSEFLPHLFDPFRQEYSGSKTEYQGTGLGMCITKRILDLLGGDIQVESQKGVGTKVSIILPMQIASEEQILEAKTQRKNMDVTHAELKGKRILLCEDHPLNAAITIRLLDKCGCQVIHAENGKDGVELFYNSIAGYFDAILMDIRMPVMDGLEATRAIRELDREDATSIPIIAMSANSFDEDVTKSLVAGMNAHIAKPIELDKFFRCILSQLPN